MNVSRSASMPYQIRPIAEADAPALMRFYNRLSPASKRTFHPLGTTATLEQCVEVCENNVGSESDRYDVVGFADGQIVGWGFLWGLRSDEASLGLAVADTWQQRGLGTTLMRAMVQHARTLPLPAIHLACVEDNSIAQRLYESFGFERSDRHTGEDGRPYVGMTAKLAP